MKQKLLFASIALLMSSCSVKTYYQIVDVKSTNLQKESKNYVYNDGVCKIVYNFWSNGGKVAFSIENLSDEIIYVDLANSFLIVNGWAYDYYKARNYGVGKSFQITQGKSAGKSAGISKGVSSGISASAAASGIWKGGPLDGYRGSLSAQASCQVSSLASYQVSSQISSSISEGLSSNLAIAEKPIVAIPPHSLKSFSEYIIMGDVIQDCSVRLKVKKNQPEGLTLTESESPMKFRNYITYRMEKSEETKVVSNDFYIGGFKNYMSSDIIQTKVYGCKKTVMRSSNNKNSPDRFYIKYNQNHLSGYSLDASFK